MKLIPLTQGKFATVDDADFEPLSKLKWFLHSRGYAARMERVDGKQVTVMMHRRIIGARKGLHVDHRDGNKLNNTRSNLRECTSAQNACNRAAARSNRLGLKGVWSSGKKFCASIKINGARVYLGTFQTLRDALDARMALEPIMHGEFAYENKEVHL